MNILSLRNFTCFTALIGVVAAESALQRAGPSSRLLLASSNLPTEECSEAIAGYVANGPWRNSNGAAQLQQLADEVNAVLINDTRCSSILRSNTSKTLELTWMQYPAWLNGIFTQWVWELKTGNATAAIFQDVIFEGPQQMPPPNIITDPAIMRDYAAVHNDDAVVYSSDLSGFSASYTVDQKGITDYVENACLDKSNPRGMMHPRTLLLLFYRADALAALHAAGATSSSAPPDDWDSLLAVLSSHAAALAAADAAGTPTSYPRYGVCITTDTSCGRAGDVLAAIAASIVQSQGTQQGYVFDLTAAQQVATALVNGSGWRLATEVMHRLLSYNAPEGPISDMTGLSVDTAASSAAANSSMLQCFVFNPWFASGECLFTIEWDVAFMSMNVPVLQQPGVLGVAPLPGSRMVAVSGTSGAGGSADNGATVNATLTGCSNATCALSANHDMLYLTAAGQKPAALEAARAAGAKCGSGEVGRMEAAAMAALRAVDGGGVVESIAFVNRAPYSALFDYHVYINYERVSANNLAQEISLVQSRVASRMDNERRLRQRALEELRRATTGGDLSTWQGAAYPSTPWWAGLGQAAAAGGGAGTNSYVEALPALPAEALYLFTSLGLDAGAATSYLRALWHGLHSPNAATDIPAPAMVNWFKWGCSHAALSLSLQPSSPSAATSLLARVFAMVNEAHTPALVRSCYEVAINASSQQRPWKGFSTAPAAVSTAPDEAHGLATGTLVAVVVSVAAGVALVGATLVMVVRLRNRHRDLLGRVLAPRAGQDTTLLISDVQSSTALWEQLPVPVMDATLRLHHNTVRQLLPRYDGYESATEGDSFILAFANPANAMAFAAACQVALMLQEWPQELLQHEDAAPVLVDPQSGEAASQAGVPGAHGWRAGSRSPLPSSIITRVASMPAQYFMSRARVAAAGRGGGVGSTTARTPSVLRAHFSGPSMYDMSSYDMSAHGGVFMYNMRRSMERVRTGLLGGGGAAAPAASTATGVAPAADDAKASMSMTLSSAQATGGGPAAAATAAGVTASCPVVPAAATAEATVPDGALQSKCVAFHGVADGTLREASMLSGPAGREGSLLMGAAAREGSLLATAVGREGSILSGLARVCFSPRTEPRGPATLPSQSEPPVLTPSISWETRLVEVFPTVPLQEAPPAVMGPSLLKDPWVLLPSGRLVLLAYRGLRVRMGIHTGLDDPQHIAFNKVGSSYKYYGPFAEAAKCATEAAPGGMVILSSQAFTRLRDHLSGSGPAPANASRIHTPDAVVLYGGHHMPKAVMRPSTKGLVPPPLAAAPAGASSVPAPQQSAGGGGGRGVTPPPEGIAFYQAVPSALVCRLALSPPIVSAKTVQLGSLAAPTGCITVAFMYVVGASTLLADLPGPAAKALDQFQRLVCRLLGSRGGYLVEGGDGLVLAAFGNPAAAVEWALDCVAGLKKVDWEDELLGHWLCEEVLSVGLAGGEGLADIEESAQEGEGDPVVAAGRGTEDGATGGDGGRPGSRATSRAASVRDRALSPAASSSRRSLRRALSRMPSMARLGARATTKRVLERGLRIKVGLASGLASHVLSSASGRLSYRGKVMNRASRVAGKAASGQVVCTDTVWQGCMAAQTAAAMMGGSSDLEGEDMDGLDGASEGEPAGGLVGVSLGMVTLRGVSAPVELIQCMRGS